MKQNTFHILSHSIALICLKNKTGKSNSCDQQEPKGQKAITLEVKTTKKKNGKTHAHQQKKLRNGIETSQTGEENLSLPYGAKYWA